jgi:hypothetical protein
MNNRNMPFRMARLISMCTFPTSPRRHDATRSGTWSFAGNLSATIRLRADFIARVVPHFRGSLLGDKTWSVMFDNRKIKTFVPGFQAVIPFREGIRRTVAWFDADEKRKRIDAAVNQEMDEILKAYGQNCG